MHILSHRNSFDNTRLFVQTWQPEIDPKAVICLVHGIGEHSSRYCKWAERFVENGYAVVGFDQRGHGLSEGKRGVISSYQDFMSDIDEMLEETNVLFPSIPFILYGHSMGGGEVLNHLIRRNANYLGVISTSPWIETQAAPAKFLISFLRFMNRFIPSFSIKTSFNAKRLSHIKEVWNKYEQDELIHHMVSFRLFIDSYDAGYYALENANKVEKPLLLLHGDEDQITNSKASQIFSENCSNWCTFIKYQNAYHELHNDYCKDLVFSDILFWIESRLRENIKTDIS